MKKSLVIVAVLLTCVKLSFAQDGDEYVDSNDPVWADINILLKTALYQDHGSVEPSWKATRYELAVYTARGMRNFGLIGGPGNNKVLPPESPRSPLLNRAEVLGAVKRLATKFRPELQKFGIYSEQIIINGLPLVEPKPATSTANVELPKLPVVPAFADVPLNHWAYAAVETLRQNGIMIGTTPGPITVFNLPSAK